MNFVVLYGLLTSLAAVVAQDEQETTHGHITGCGCTTTTTCNPDPVGSSCPSHQPRPGKRGPVGPKGGKGDVGEVSDEALVGMRDKISALEEGVEDLKILNKIFFRYPSTCSAYHDNGFVKDIEDVPQFYTKSGEMVMTFANCTKLEEIHQLSESPLEIGVPKNSLMGRTLVLEGAPKQPHAFSVNFYADSPERIFFHVDVRPTTQWRWVVRNDNSGTSSSGWGREEITSGDEFPFDFGVPFKIEIKTDDIGFHAKLDGKDLFTFNHRQRPPNAITRIVLGGQLDLTLLSFN